MFRRQVHLVLTATICGLFTSMDLTGPRQETSGRRRRPRMIPCRVIFVIEDQPRRNEGRGSQGCCEVSCVGDPPRVRGGGRAACRQGGGPLRRNGGDGGGHLA